MRNKTEFVSGFIWFLLVILLAVIPLIFQLGGAFISMLD